MIKRQALIFNILIGLYTFLFILSVFSLIEVSIDFSIFQAFINFGGIYTVVQAFFLYFLYKKNEKTIFYIFFISTYILLTSPVFFNINEGVLDSIKMVFGYLSDNHYQAFSVSFLSWLIPIISGMGVIFYLIDKNKNGMKG